MGKRQRWLKIRVELDRVCTSPRLFDFAFIPRVAGVHVRH